MRERLMRFMQGRYGSDQLGRCMSGLCMVFLIISLFGGRIFYTLALILLILNYTRMLSRNIPARYRENQIFLAKTASLRQKLAKKQKELQILKTHHIYKCPTCKQKIRVPRGRGRIEIRCQRCGTKFIKKS